MPEISIIIPSYQHGDTIAKCLDSVFGQTLKDIEVIVVNDGSTDNTADATKPYLGKITYEEIPNGGAQKARNRGFGLSHGRFVMFLDADIVMKPTMLQELHDALKAHPEASYAYCGFRFGIAHFKGERFDAERLRKINFIHTSALVRREDFFGFDESLKRFQDWDLWLTMLEKGKKGVAVEKTLFSAKPRSAFGMSQWRPKIFFSPIFGMLGIKSKAVEKYRIAAEIIAKKHGLNVIATPSTPLGTGSARQSLDHDGLRPRDDGFPWWILILAVFALSALTFKNSIASTVISLIAVAITIAATRNRLLYGAIIMLSELIFGSLAGKTLAIHISDFTVPLRLSVFAIVGAFWLIRMAQKRVHMPPKNAIFGVALVLAAVGWGIANGLLNGIPLRDVFFDANAYFALPMILIFFSATETERDQKTLLKCLKHGAIALSALTLAALFFFGHRFPNEAGVFAYKWLRDSRIAEITALDGGIYRVFIQSQIFCMFAFLWVTLKKRGQTPFPDTAPISAGWKDWLWGALPAAALLVSGSRSFAVGIAAAGLVWITMALLPSLRAQARQSRDHRSALGASRDDVKAWGAIKKLSIFAIGAILIYVAILAFPFPSPRSQTSFQDMLRSRSVSDRDAATASRWALLPKLNEKIMRSPIFGNGFGTTVTYQSFDQRIVSTTGGAYTTSAFEWNYQDILVKIGLLGLLAYGFLLWAIFSMLRKSERRLWLVPSFFALLATNALSPYLNHPLGIGFLALLLALAQSKNDRTAIAVKVEATKRMPSAAAAAAPCSMAMSEK